MKYVVRVSLCRSSGCANGICFIGKTDKDIQLIIHIVPAETNLTEMSQLDFNVMTNGLHMQARDSTIFTFAECMCKLLKNKTSSSTC